MHLRGSSYPATGPFSLAGKGRMTLHRLRLLLLLPAIVFILCLSPVLSLWTTRRPAAVAAAATTATSRQHTGLWTTTQHQPSGSKTSEKQQGVWEKGGKWDTGVFLRAVVQSQKDQIHEELQRVRSWVPPALFINMDRSAEELGRGAGRLLVASAGSYMQSAVLGYAFGFVGMAVADKKKKAIMESFFPGRSFHVKGVKQAREFGEFCGLLTLFEGGMELIRGKQDKWNSVVGAFGVGMYTARRSTLANKLKAGAMFGGFNLVLGGMAPPPNKEEEEGGKGGKKQPQQQPVGKGGRR